MTRQIAGSTIALVTASSLSLLAAVVTGDWVLVVLAAPLALAGVLGLTGKPPPLPEVHTSIEPLLLSTSSTFTVEIVATSETPQICSLNLLIPPDMEADGPCRWDVYLRPGVSERWSLGISPLRSGRFALGEVDVTSEAIAPGWRCSGRTSGLTRVEARPDPVRMKELVRSDRVRAQAGDRTGKLPAEGIEFAEVREQPAGAMERRINWRASARRGTTCVNLHHPERNTDVMLLADTFSSSTLPAVVRISVNLAEAYLARHDRLGLVCFGGVIDWVEPGSGPVHADRVRSALLSSEWFFSYAEKGADLIPRRFIPPGCLVIAVSPLTDDRFVRTIANLRERGLDLAIVEISPEWPEGTTPSGRLATRILQLEREALRHAFWGMGTVIATVEPTDGADVALASLLAVRRALRRRAPV
ncbi:MAG: DUF58 domain-containing protein [Acidimicrobiales bacterium]|jgi:uncharacterized protein (DUF58 family)